MLKVGLPEGAILQSFIKDGIQDEDEQKEIMKILRGGDQRAEATTEKLSGS